MTERQRDFIIYRWNKCDKNTKLQIAAEFFTTTRNGELPGDWWQYLDKKLSTLTWNDLYSDTESRTRSAY